jgi:Glycosyltransferases involved in cell wall biogenesis
MPARNEASRVQRTIQSLVSNKETSVSWEIIVVDDVSNDRCCDGLKVAAPRLTLTVVKSRRRLGVARARNLGAAKARGKVLFMTDSHVELCPGWDRLVLKTVKPGRIAAATITDRSSRFRGYGCSLVVPFMGTRWNRAPLARGLTVQIASAAGTALSRDLFWRIGGYDEGMRVYGAAEPEFSVRAWLSGAKIVSADGLEVSHRFKPRADRDAFIGRYRTDMVHNNLRFGLLYLSQMGVLQMIRHYSMTFPRHLPKACRLLSQSDVWERRSFLRKSLRFDFEWFIHRFDLLDQSGNQIL